MTFLSLLAALLLEQVRPTHADGEAQRWFGRLAAAVEERLDGGLYQHGMVGWTAVLAPLLAVAAGLYHLLDELSPVAAWLWSVAVLHVTVGFGRFAGGGTLEEFNAAIMLAATDFAASAEEFGRLIEDGVNTGNIPPGGTLEVVFDLAPGRYVISGGAFSIVDTVELEVTAAPEVRPAPPESAFTVSMVEFEPAGVWVLLARILDASGIGLKQGQSQGRPQGRAWLPITSAPSAAR